MHAVLHRQQLDGDAGLAVGAVGKVVGRVVRRFAVGDSRHPEKHPRSSQVRHTPGMIVSKAHNPACSI